MSNGNSHGKIATFGPPIISGIFAVIAAVAGLWASQATGKTSDAKDEAVNAAKSIQVPIGTILPFAGPNPPKGGWLLCDGSEISESEWPKLFHLLKKITGGGYYGENSQSGKLKLPDLRGRGPIGFGQGEGKDEQGNPLTQRDLGKAFGAENHLLLEHEMPRHRHKMKQPTNSHLKVPKGAGQSAWHGILEPEDEIGEFQTGYNGDGQSHNNMQPSLAINFIIKAK